MESEWNWAILPDSAEELFGLAYAQWEVLQMLKQGMTRDAIAKARGISLRNTDAAIAKAKKRLLKHGYDLTGNITPVPPPHFLKGKSTLMKYNEEGEAVKALEWVKTDTDKNAQQEAFEKAVERLCEGIKPFKRVNVPKETNGDLLTNYVITDFHLGMYAWGLETGEDWDMDIAEAVLLNAFAEMMDGSPDSEVAIFSQMGDLLHWDGMLAVTPQNKHVLDADTRFDLLVETAMNVCAKAVEMLLHKHKNVHVIHCEGNHDPASSVWLRRASAREFRNNQRVTVETSPFPFYHYAWGKTFLGWHHGHLQKMESLPLVFSTDPKFRQDFGGCEYAYIKTGHRHQKEVIEKGGVIVEQVETLAARDAYAARGFPYSQRGTVAVTYSKDKGEVSRVTVRPDSKVLV